MATKVSWRFVKAVMNPIMLIFVLPALVTGVDCTDSFGNMTNYIRLILTHPPTGRHPTFQEDSDHGNHLRCVRVQRQRGEGGDGHSSPRQSPPAPRDSSVRLVTRCLAVGDRLAPIAQFAL